MYYIKGSYEKKQAVSELGQAQVESEANIEVVVKVGVSCEFIKIWSEFCMIKRIFLFIKYMEEVICRNYSGK